MTIIHDTRADLSDLTDLADLASRLGDNLLVNPETPDMVVDELPAVRLPSPHMDDDTLTDSTVVYPAYAMPVPSYWNIAAERLLQRSLPSSGLPYPFNSLDNLRAFLTQHKAYVGGSFAAAAAFGRDYGGIDVFCYGHNSPVVRFFQESKDYVETTDTKAWLLSCYLPSFLCSRMFGKVRVVQMSRGFNIPSDLAQYSDFDVAGFSYDGITFWMPHTYGPKPVILPLVRPNRESLTTGFDMQHLEARIQKLCSYGYFIPTMHTVLATLASLSENEFIVSTSRFWKFVEDKGLHCYVRYFARRPYLFSSKEDEYTVMRLLLQSTRSGIPQIEVDPIECKITPKDTFKGRAEYAQFVRT